MFDKKFNGFSKPKYDQLPTIINLKKLISLNEITAEKGANILLKYLKENSLNLVVKNPNGETINVVNNDDIKTILESEKISAEIIDPYENKIFQPSLPEILKPEIFRKYFGLAISTCLALNSLIYSVYEFNKTQLEVKKEEIIDINGKYKIGSDEEYLKENATKLYSRPSYYDNNLKKIDNLRGDFTQNSLNHELINLQQETGLSVNIYNTKGPVTVKKEDLVKLKEVALTVKFLNDLIGVKVVNKLVISLEPIVNAKYGGLYTPDSEAVMVNVNSSEWSVILAHEIAHHLTKKLRIGINNNGSFSSDTLFQILYFFPEIKDNPQDVYNNPLKLDNKLDIDNYAFTAGVDGSLPELLAVSFESALTDFFKEENISNIDNKKLVRFAKMLAIFKYGFSNEGDLNHHLGDSKTWFKMIRFSKDTKQIVKNSPETKNLLTQYIIHLKNLENQTSTPLNEETKDLDKMIDAELLKITEIKKFIKENSYITSDHLIIEKPSKFDNFSEIARLQFLVTNMLYSTLVILTGFMMVSSNIDDYIFSVNKNNRDIDKNNREKIKKEIFKAILEGYVNLNSMQLKSKIRNILLEYLN